MDIEKSIRIIHWKGIGTGIAWMFLVSLMLWWLPVFGPVIAGIVGGKKSRSLGNALGAIFLPAIVLRAVLFFATAALPHLPILGSLFGVLGTLIALPHVGLMLLGAILGALFA